MSLFLQYVPALQRVADRDDILGSITRRVCCVPSTSAQPSSSSPNSSSGPQQEAEETIPLTPRTPSRPASEAPRTRAAPANEHVSPCTPPPPGVLRRRHMQSVRQAALASEQLHLPPFVVQQVSLRWLASHRVLLRLLLLLLVVFLYTPSWLSFSVCVLIGCVLLLMMSHTAPHRTGIS